MPLLRIVCTIAWLLISFAISCPPIEAQSTNNTNIHSGSNSSKSRKRDSNRTSGGDRGQCQALDSAKKFIALVPKKGEVVISSNTPTFLFYVPYSSNSTLNTRFSLQEENGYSIIKPPIIRTLSGTPGLIKVPLVLPQTVTKGKFYRWFFTIICDPKDGSKNMVVDGWLRKEEPSSTLTNQLKKKLPPQELAALYKKEGFLIDALAILAENRDKDPQSKSEWNSTLQFLNLEDIAQEKIAQ